MRQNRAQKTSNREKYGGKHGDQKTSNEQQTTKLDFSHLTQEQIAEERQRLNRLFLKRKRKNIIITSLAVIFIVSTFITVYYYLLN